MIECIYLFESKATDSSGNSATEQKSFHVRKAMADYVFDDFDSEASLQTLTMQQCPMGGWQNCDQTYHETFEGRTGVVSGIMQYEYGPHAYVTFSMTEEELAAIDFEYIYIRAYVGYSGTSGATTVTVSLKNIVYGEYNIGEWFEIRLTPELIENPGSPFVGAGISARENFNKQMTTPGGGYLFYCYVTAGLEESARYRIYLDEIGYKPVPSVSALPETATLGDTLTLNGVPNIKNATIEYTVKDPDGVAVPLNENSFRCMKEGRYEITSLLTFGEEHATVKHYLEVNGNGKTIEVLPLEGEFKQGDEITLPVGTFEGESASVKVFYNNQEVEVSDNKFTVDFYGDYQVVYSATDGEFSYQKKLTVSVERIVADNEIQSFDSADSIDNWIPIQVNYSSLEWLREFEGERGVVKYTFNGEWPAASFKAAKPVASYTNYQYIVFRLYFPASDNTFSAFNMLNDMAGQVYCYSYERGKWVDLKFPMSCFTNNWKDDGSQPDWNVRIWSDLVSTETDGYFYIASIYGANDPNLSVSFGEAKVGEEVEPVITNPNGVDYVLTVFDGEGANVVLQDGKFTPTKAGKYSYVLHADGQLDVKGTFDVVKVLSKTISTENTFESIEVGATAKMNVSIVKGDQEDVISYVSSDTTVATVAADGTINGVGVGFATISAFIGDDSNVVKCAVQVSYGKTVLTSMPIGYLHTAVKQCEVIWLDDYQNAGYGYVTFELTFKADGNYLWIGEIKNFTENRTNDANWGDKARETMPYATVIGPDYYGGAPSSDSFPKMAHPAIDNGGLVIVDKTTGEVFSGQAITWKNGHTYSFTYRLTNGNTLSFWYSTQKDFGGVNLYNVWNDPAHLIPSDYITYGSFYGVYTTKQD